MAGPRGNVPGRSDMGRQDPKWQTDLSDRNGKQRTSSRHAEKHPLLEHFCPWGLGRCLETVWLDWAGSTHLGAEARDAADLPTVRGQPQMPGVGVTWARPSMGESRQERTSTQAVFPACPHAGGTTALLEDLPRACTTKHTTRGFQNICCT